MLDGPGDPSYTRIAQPVGFTQDLGFRHMFKMSDKKSLIAFVVAVLLPVSILSANTASKAGNLPKVTIPRTATAPTLDGKLASGEWDDAATHYGSLPIRRLAVPQRSSDASMGGRELGDGPYYG